MFSPIHEAEVPDNEQNHGEHRVHECSYHRVVRVVLLRGFCAGRARPCRDQTVHGAVVLYTARLHTKHSQVKHD